MRVRKIYILLVFLLLSNLTMPAIACPPPDCGNCCHRVSTGPGPSDGYCDLDTGADCGDCSGCSPCYTCVSCSCDWDCTNPGATCCNGSCCNRRFNSRYGRRIYSPCAYFCNSCNPHGIRSHLWSLHGDARSRHWICLCHL